MKTFSNANARDVRQAIALSADARQQGRAASFAGGGSDLLALVKERVVSPDVIVSLKPIKGFDRVAAEGGGLTIGGLITLDALSRDPAVRRQYGVLAEAAGSVATPQIRNVGTLAGNLCQRPWCWYYRNGFACFKAGGNQCFSVAGENQFHAIFGGGPSYIVRQRRDRAADGGIDLSKRARRARRCGADSVAAPGGRARAHRSGDHRGRRRAGRRDRDRRRASARQERVQASADEESGPEDDPRSRAPRLNDRPRPFRSVRACLP